ncbi:MAG: hypothetical protein K0U36_06625, partial [Alphaproteobacteria bacterium]|nr:hypothetical protein [Alphaproteobacteria bacterium]
GKCMVNGKEMEIALWVKDTKTGEKFFSASFSEPYVAQEPTIKDTRTCNRQHLQTTMNDNPKA